MGTATEMSRLEGTLRENMSADASDVAVPASGVAGGDAALRRAKIQARQQLFGAGLCFGLMAVTARFASRGAGGFSAQQLATLRFGIGLLATVALFRLRPGTFRPVKHRLLFTRGALGGVAAVLYFVSIEHLSAGEATLLNNTFPVFATLLSFFTLGERPTVHLALALAITSAGVFLVLGGGSLSFGLGLGELAGLASALLGAGAVTSIRVLRATDNAPTIFFAFCVGGLLCAFPFSLTPWTGDLTLWLAALATGVLSIAAQLLMTQSYGALTVPEAAVWQQLTPVSSYLWALLLLDERVNLVAAMGVLLVVFGVVWGVVFGAKPRLER